MTCGWEWDDEVGMWRLGGEALAVEEPPSSGEWWASVWYAGVGPEGEESGPHPSHHAAIDAAEKRLAERKGDAP